VPFKETLTLKRVKKKKRRGFALGFTQCDEGNGWVGTQGSPKKFLLFHPLFKEERSRINFLP